MYPFKPPSITVNGHNYMRLRKLLNNGNLNILTLLSLCCSSLLCINNWSPHKNMSDQLQKFAIILTLKIKFNEIRHVKKIKV